MDFISECNRLLKENGLFICSTNNRNILTAGWRNPLNPYHTHEFSEKEFSYLLTSHFLNVSFFGQLLVSPFRRFIYMLYYTIGFILVRTRIFSFINSFFGLLINKLNRDSSLKSYYPIKSSNFRDLTPGYLIAICQGVKSE